MSQDSAGERPAVTVSADDGADVVRRLNEAHDAYEASRRQLRRTRDTLREVLRRPGRYDPGRTMRLLWSCERALGNNGRFFSEAGQDMFLDRQVFKGRRGGVFVEVGAHDGVAGSNCLFFEAFRGWTGLMIEPSPSHYAAAAKARSATGIECAIAAEAGTAEFLDIRRGYTQMSGLTASYDGEVLESVEKNPRHEGELITVETRPLAEVLDEHGLAEVDYVSLDVEGAEPAILEGFPFDRIRVKAWTVENRDRDAKLRGLMRGAGYRLAAMLGLDDVFVLDGEGAG